MVWSAASYIDIRHPRVSRLLLIKSRGGPGCEDGPGFLRGGLLRAWAAKSRGYDDAAEFDGHVVVGRFGFRGVPAGSGSVTGHIVGAMTVQRVPDGDDAETDQPERHGPFHGATCPIAGLPDSHDLAGVSEGLLDSPPGPVASYQIFRRRVQIGGDRAPAVTSSRRQPGRDLRRPRRTLAEFLCSNSPQSAPASTVSLTKVRLTPDQQDIIDIIDVSTIV